MGISICGAHSCGAREHRTEQFWPPTLNQCVSNVCTLGVSMNHKLAKCPTCIVGRAERIGALFRWSVTAGICEFQASIFKPITEISLAQFNHRVPPLLVVQSSWNLKSLIDIMMLTVLADIRIGRPRIRIDKIWKVCHKSMLFDLLNGRNIMGKPMFPRRFKFVWTWRKIYTTLENTNKK